MNITILSSNKSLLSFYGYANKEYEKRLSKYCKLNTIYVTSPNCILENVKNNFVINVNKQFKTITSEDLASNISSLSVSSKSNILFILVDFTHNTKSDFNIAISNSNLNNQLLQTLLLEQIYRSFKIINNESYHK